MPCRAMLVYGKSAWIGLEKRKRDAAKRTSIKDWFWKSREECTYTNWGSYGPFPDNYDGTEHCVHVSIARTVLFHLEKTSNDMNKVRG